MPYRMNSPPSSTGYEPQAPASVSEALGRLTAETGHLRREIDTLRFEINDRLKDYVPGGQVVSQTDSILREMEHLRTMILDRMSSLERAVWTLHARTKQQTAKPASTSAVIFDWLLQQMPKGLAFLGLFLGQWLLTGSVAGAALAIEHYLSGSP